MVRLSWLRRLCQALAFFFFSDTASTEIYTLSYTTLFRSWRGGRTAAASVAPAEPSGDWLCLDADPRSDYRAQPQAADRDRKSTRLNSSHSQISYAVFCLKKKKHPIRHAGDAGTDQVPPNG